MAAAETSNSTAAKALASAAAAIGMAASADNSTHHATSAICHDVSLIFDHETPAAKEFCKSFDSMLLCADYCSDYCLTKVDTSDPCHPKLDADGDGTVDGKEPGVVARRNQKNASASMVFIVVFGLLCWASYHTSKARREFSPRAQRMPWQQEQPDEESQGISMVPQTWDEAASDGSGLMPKGYQRSETRGTSGYY